MNVTSTLLLSLKQDIQTLNNLLGEIKKRHEINTLKSWLFPSKPHEVVANIIFSKSFKSASYEQALELALDRLYVLINFFLIYTDKSTRDSGSIFIAQPRKSSLGLCVKLLWDNIEKLMAKQGKTKTARISGNCDDKQSQTEIISLNMCDSCSSAILCMKRLLKSLDNQPDQTKIRYQIFDITQFGCMLKVTASIEDAFNNLYKQWQQGKIETGVLKSENENYNAKLRDKEARIEFLQEEVNVLRRQMEKDSRTILELRQEQSRFIKDVDSKESNICSLKETIQNLGITLRSLTNENKSLKNENSLLHSSVEKSVQVLSKHNAKIGQRIAKMDNECRIIKLIIDQYEKSISCLNIKLVKITKNIGKLELKHKNNFDNTSQILGNFFKYEAFCVKIKDVFKEKISNIKNPQEAMSIKGNPVEDIAKQIQENRNKIEDLENENVKLQALLDRFKCMKFNK